MCYSAQISKKYRAFVRATGAKMDIKSYVELFWTINQGEPSRRPKMPRGLEREALEHGPPEVTDLIRRWDAWEIDRLTREQFDQRRRVADAERALQTKETKKSLEDVRIGTNKVKAAQRRLDVIKGKSSAQDRRIYPGMYCPVLVEEEGVRLIKPMRYQCRPAGKPASYDRRYPGTYNARRDNLEGFWRGQFARSHGVMVADRFYERVEVDGESVELEFEPRTGEPMLIACLWSRWSDPKGLEPDLLSFAAITDEPEPEVAQAGHDRTVINIKPEHLQAWLNPDPADLEKLYAIFDDRRHPYYENRLAA